ncbi:PHO85 cyclin-2 [Hypsizygus marmoreus]|uniref:PHO85 cyclin-2 n=1 Tax=Hypsizygus marmoreus TaxID=39966 RepID=A0A369JSJ2_HYPMA|nr:PHO85 cyclin-2 [Hypsizygus marmoreus]
MASNPGPARPDLRKNLNASQNRYPPTNPPRAPPNRSEQFYGHEEIARLSARFITHLFACPEMPPASTNSQSKLPNFIAYALHRTKLHESVTFAALILLQRLKARFPTARGSSGHRLFISAFMIASKVICDDTYSNKSWSIVAQGMFSLREINQMEREMCSYLDWELSVDDNILTTFEERLREDFKSADGPYPTFPLSMVSKRAAKAAASTTTTPVPDTTAGAIPPLGQQRHETPTKPATGSPRSPTTWASPPDTPSPSYSNSTSPASSGSPATPVGGDDYNPKVRGFDSPPIFAITKDMPPVHPLKGQMFAMAMPSTW